MDFRSGPFEFACAPKGASVAGVQMNRWTLFYGHQRLGEKMLPRAATQTEVREAFEGDLGRFVVEAKSRCGSEPYELVTPAGDVLARVVLSAVEGLAPCIPDDRFPFWVVTAQKPTRGEPVTLEQFGLLVANHLPAPRAWIADMLPEAVLTTDPAAWAPPSSWQIRHVVGEGSFTGITGAAAAALVGVSPQNFRKYTAADDARTRQPISFSMWHLLLHKLGVQWA